MNYFLYYEKNLPQFRDKPHEEIKQYILDTKRVDVGSNFNFGKIALWILLGLIIVVGGIGLVRWLQQRKEKKNDDYTIDANTINY